DHGATVIEADHLGHDLLEPDGYAFAAVSDRWPTVVSGHHIDRSALAAIVFSDASQLAELEAMTHSAIIERISDVALSAGHLVVEVPLILGIPGRWTKVFIDADEDLRMRRAVDRGADEIDVRNRMASQPHRDEWIAWADETIDNNGSAEDLDRQIDLFWHGLRAAGYGVRSADHGRRP
ncbi:MAG: dephospho-CoA kinase, partial [Actinomycetota bacterium]|nr:dephospho-CoA kinase [Actinomycetota bacterium]